MSRQQTELVKPLRFSEEQFDAEPPPGQERGEGMLHLADLLARLLGRWHLIALGLLLGCSIGLYQVWRAVPRYEAIAKVLVKDNSLSLTGQREVTDFDLGNSQAVLETVRTGMLTYPICEAVAADPEVRALKHLVPPKPKRIPFFSGSGSGSGEEGAAVADLAPPVPQLASLIQGWLTVKAQPQSRILHVTVAHPRAEIAQVIANKLVYHYQSEREEARSKSMGGTIALLDTERERLEGDLQKYQGLFASYTTTLSAEGSLGKVEKELALLKLKYRHKHPRMIEAMIRLNNAKESLRNFLGRAVQNSFDAEYWNNHRALTADLEDEQNLVQVRELLIARRVVLQSQIATKTTGLNTLALNEGAKKVDEKQRGSEVTMHEVARKPALPTYPRKTRMILTAAALGLFAGLGLAYLFQALDNKFHTVADAESQLKIPVLASVVDLDEETMREGQAKEGEKGTLTLCAPGREDWAPSMVFRNDGANSHYAEMFRVLRTSISLLGPASQRKITMITSALPSEGKTLVAANLAVALAQQGQRTLLVDFDLRKPSTHKMFGVSKSDKPGTVDLLADNAGLEDVMHSTTGQENLTVILSGAKAPNPGELLEAIRLEALLKTLREHFDHIVIDTAPLLAVPDSRIIAPLVDNLALVVRAESTPRGAVKRVLQVLDSAGVTPEGIVFNGFRERRSFMGKNYSYGYYRYSYGKYSYGKYQYGSYGSVYGDDEEKES